MEHTQPQSSRAGLWFARGLFVITCLLALAGVASLVASFFPTEPYTWIGHQYVLCVLLLGVCVFSFWLLKFADEELRSALPAATICGLLLGILLGSIFNLPFYLALLLAASILGIWGATNPTANGLPNPYISLDVTLTTLAFVASILLYSLVAFLVARRTGRRKTALWGTFLTALITLLVAAVTNFIVAATPLFDRGSTWPGALYVFLPLMGGILLLSLAQALHAILGALIGCLLARLVRRGRGNRPSDVAPGAAARPSA